MHAREGGGCVQGLTSSEKSVPLGGQQLTAWARGWNMNRSVAVQPGTEAQWPRMAGGSWPERSKARKAAPVAPAMQAGSGVMVLEKVAQIACTPGPRLCQCQPRDAMIRPNLAHVHPACQH